MKLTIAEQDRQRNFTKFKKNFETKLGSLNDSIQMADFTDKRGSTKIVINENDNEANPHEDRMVDTPTQTKIKHVNHGENN